MSASHLLKKDSILNVDTTLANTDLSNLSNTGEAHFTNPDLSNLSTEGQAVLNGKANTSLSNIDATGQAKFDAKANVDLNNLSTAGQAILNGKADINLSNLNNTGNAAASNLNSKGIRTVVETYQNGNNWYRVWSDGWIEQGGAQTNTSAGAITVTVSLIRAFATTNYTVMRAPFWGAGWGGAGSDGYTTGIFSQTTTGFTCATHANSMVSKIMWFACGY